MLGLALKASFSTCSTMLLNLSVLLSNFLALLPRSLPAGSTALSVSHLSPVVLPGLGLQAVSGENCSKSGQWLLPERSPGDVWGQTGLKIELYSSRVCASLSPCSSLGAIRKEVRERVPPTHSHHTHWIFEGRGKTISSSFLFGWF